nr:immunoglobulin heavy chain junction region [Macaca mulatta]MOW98286.1 immunoglobulin heavy chain junction region [Macaca mulatta]MOW98326.1 immunoglobulin heavy chain junction region [Macaca mulatta]MOW98434.1 immunoglobulin heavy chain junction region [Macaca mulatta]MOW98485.1 immunoglobulin heavy chain junction region [Macaca mulatta]
CSRGIYW